MEKKLRILWLKTGPLHPLDSGGKLRTFNMLRELKKNHAITYLSLWPEDGDAGARQEASAYSDEQIWVPWRETHKFSLPFYAGLAGNWLASGRPYVIDKYQSAEMAAKIAELDRAKNFDLIISDFLTPSVNLFPNNARPGTRS